MQYWNHVLEYSLCLENKQQIMPNNIETLTEVQYLLYIGSLSIKKYKISM